MSRMLDDSELRSAEAPGKLLLGGAPLRFESRKSRRAGGRVEVARLPMYQHDDRYRGLHSGRMANLLGARIEGLSHGTNRIERSAAVGLRRRGRRGRFDRRGLQMQRVDEQCCG